DVIGVDIILELKLRYRPYSPLYRAFIDNRSMIVARHPGDGDRIDQALEKDARRGSMRWPIMPFLGRIESAPEIGIQPLAPLLVRQQPIIHFEYVIAKFRVLGQIEQQAGGLRMPGHECRVGS